MNIDLYLLPAVILLAVGCFVIVLSKDWRLGIGALGLIYLGIFILVLPSWPIEMAVVKIVAGWIAASVLGISISRVSDLDEYTGRYELSEIVFRLAAGGLAGLVAYSLSASVGAFFYNVPIEVVGGALILIVLGILHLGLTVNPFQSILGLLLVYGGFEMIYAVVENSVLVAGALAFITLAIALGGAYLVTVPDLEPEE